MTLTPQFRFGPIDGVESMNYSLSRGIQPSVCTIRLPFNASLASVLSKGRTSAMVLSDGQRTIRLKDCVVSDIDMSVDSDGGQSMVIAILDRRWRWKYSQVSGEYNVRQADSLDEGTAKTPQELASILLKAMGEKNFDVKRMPNKTYPYVNWNMTVPAVALQELCSDLKCHICYCADDVVRIFEDGIGNDLPNVPSSSSGVGFDVGARPGKIGAASGAFQWQFDFPLEPVGLDMDGVIKPIDELSYAPKTDKWKYIVPATMNGVQDAEYVKGRKGKTGSGTKEDERNVAKKTIWRWYRILLPKGFSKVPIADTEMRSVRQFLPFLDFQLEYENLDDVQKISVTTKGSAYEKQIRRRLPQQVWGLFYEEAGAGDDNVDDFDDSRYVSLNQSKKDSEGKVTLLNQKLIYPKGFSIDDDRMIVVFSDPVHRVVKGENAAPTLYLRTACNFRDAETRASFRLQIQRSVGGPDASVVEWQSREDVIPEWRDSSTGEVYNGKEIEKELNYYLDSTKRKYDSRIPGNIEVPWLMPYSPDGRIAQVNFSISGEGFIGTGIHKELEGWQTPVPYKERIAQSNIAANQARLAQLYGKQNGSK